VVRVLDDDHLDDRGGSCFSTATQPQRLSYPTSARLHPAGGPSRPDRQQAIGKK
jgi:hypothetical protein